MNDADLITRRQLARFVSGLTAMAAMPHAFASTYPERVIDMVVPFAPGGSVDPIARTLAAPASDILGKSIIVDNKGGAYGNLGAAYVARSRSNAHRLFIGTDGILAMNPHLFKNVGFDPLKDFQPVAMICRGANAIAVRADSPIKTLADLVKEGQKSRDGFLYGSIAGTSQHMTGLSLAKASSGNFKLVPYKGGAPTVVDLIGGALPCAIGSFSMMKPHMEAGKVRVLAVSSKDRLTLAPQIPTVAESYSGFAEEFWYGIFTPADVPADVIAKLEQTFRQVLTTPAIKEKIAGMALTPLAYSAEETRRILVEDHQRFGRMVRENRITVE